MTSGAIARWVSPFKTLTCPFYGSVILLFRGIHCNYGWRLYSLYDEKKSKCVGELRPIRSHLSCSYYCLARAISGHSEAAVSWLQRTQYVRLSFQTVMGVVDFGATEVLNFGKLEDARRLLRSDYWAGTWRDRFNCSYGQSSVFQRVEWPVMTWNYDSTAWYLYSLLITPWVMIAHPSLAGGYLGSEANQKLLCVWFSFVTMIAAPVRCSLASQHTRVVRWSLWEVPRFGSLPSLFYGMCSALSDWLQAVMPKGSPAYSEVCANDVRAIRRPLPAWLLALLQRLAHQIS